MSTQVAGCPLPGPHDDHDCEAYATAALEGYQEAQAARNTAASRVTAEGVAENLGPVGRGSIIRLADSGNPDDDLLAGALAKAVAAVSGHHDFLVVRGDVTIDADLEQRLCDAMDPILARFGLPHHGYPLTRDKEIKCLRSLDTFEPEVLLLEPFGDGDRGDLVSDLARVVVEALRGPR